MFEYGIRVFEAWLEHPHNAMWTQRSPIACLFGEGESYVSADFDDRSSCGQSGAA